MVNKKVLISALLISSLGTCVMNAEETGNQENTSGVDNLVDPISLAYAQSIKGRYEEALFKELSDEPDQIKAQFDSVKKLNDLEEKKAVMEQDDTSLGYWGTPPTSNSANGRMILSIQQQAQQKNAINEHYYETASSKKALFDDQIVPVLKDKLERQQYFFTQHCIKALSECDKDVQCYEKHLLSPKIIEDENALKAFNEKLYACMHKKALDLGFALTFEEFRSIAVANQKTKHIAENVEKSLNDSQQLRESILNPKSVVAEDAVEKN